MKKTKAPVSTADETLSHDQSRTPYFPIVGIGASAGGLETFKELLGLLPSDTGMAFVLIQHLDPTHASHLVEALAKTTEMPVHEIQDGMRVRPNQIYVISPGSDLGISNGALTVLPREREIGKPHLPIDTFFRALATDRGSQAIGVVLSGTATDGTAGLTSIKAEYGVTLAQEPKSAKFSGMPQSAVSAGVVDFRLPIPELAQELVRLARHPYVNIRETEPIAESKDAQDLQKVFALLKKVVGVDFGEYKTATFNRRLARRMVLLKIDRFPEYVEFLRKNPGEIRALYDDVLIHVTSFFRDPEVFKKLQEDIFPEIMKEKKSGNPVRMWVSGCSTGEEVYSIAISFIEFLGPQFSEVPVQIFGSDVSERMIEKARRGVFSEHVVRDLSPSRLKRFFEKVADGYRVNKRVRELCVFVRHDLARDAPFSKLDLISCRNVLIYFDHSLQKKIISTFHYCLNQPGFLLLGRTENISGHHQLFSPADKINKIFSRAAGASPFRFPVQREGTTVERQPIERFPNVPGVRAAIDVGRHVDNLLLAQYAPPGVIINERMEVLQYRGRTGPFLEPPPGQPQINLLKMVREGMLSDLRIAVKNAKSEKTTVRREGVRFKQNGSVSRCDLVAIPVAGLPDPKEPLFVVLFENLESIPKNKKKEKISKGKTDKESVHIDERQALKFEHELKATREYLSSLNEDHQTTNDELTSVNEELVSSNEELQSLNEELETAKEELQSTNEELNTVNDELQNRSQEMSRINDDLVNLLNSADIPILILDRDRRIRRFTPKACKIMNLLPGDIGRPIDDIKPNITIDNLEEQITEVMETFTMKESEVQDRGGRWHRVQIRPYKTVENKIDGVVLSLADVDALRRAVIDAEWVRDYASGIVEAIQKPLLVLGEKMNVISANQAFYDIFGVSKTQTESRNLFEIGFGQWSIESLRRSLAEMLAQNTRFQNVEIEGDFPPLGKRVMSLSARPINSKTGMPMILLAIEDVTDRKLIEKHRTGLLHTAEQDKIQAEDANQTKDLFLATLSHELRTPLTSLLMEAQLLQRIAPDDPKIKRSTDAIERSTKMQAQLIDDLLDVSRIATGKLKMEMRTVDLAPVVRAALDTVAAIAGTKAISIESHIDESLGPVSGDPMRLQQVIWNLLTNAIKFSSKKGEIKVTLQSVEGRAKIQVVDHGIGIEPEFLPHVFDRFTQAEGSITRTFGGLGLGLAIVRHVVDAHGGTVEVKSAGKSQGAVFTVTLPLIRDRVEKYEPGEAKAVTPPDGKFDQVNGISMLKGLRILVVDDDPGTREVLTELLIQTGAVVRAAASAEEALQILPEFRPQEMICDIGMPGEDGYSLLQKIRKLGPEKGGDIPALALTALASEKDRQQAFRAGFQMHLSKPVDFDRLTDALLKLYKRENALH